MSTHFKDPAEAFAALATVIVGADQICTMEARQILFERTRHLEVFQSLDEAAFASLLEHAAESVYSALPRAEQSVTRQVMSSLVGAAAGVLSPEQRDQALGMALSLAGADEISDQELILLDELRRGLISETP